MVVPIKSLNPTHKLIKLSDTLGINLPAMHQNDLLRASGGWIAGFAKNVRAAEFDHADFAIFPE